MKSQQLGQRGKKALTAAFTAAVVASGLGALGYGVSQAYPALVQSTVTNYPQTPLVVIP